MDQSLDQSLGTKFKGLAEACAEGWARRHAEPGTVERWTFLLLDLTRILPLWSQEIADTTAHGRQHIMIRVKQALLHERRRADIGHWAYDPARHTAMKRLAAQLTAVHKQLGGTP